MGRSPCCAKEGLNRGAWTAAEDKILSDYIKMQGEGKWRSLPKRAGKPIQSEKKEKKKIEVVCKILFCEKPKWVIFSS